MGLLDILGSLFSREEVREIANDSYEHGYGDG
jgi:hypothetical protein